MLFLEPFTRSEPKKSNPASQGNDDVQEMRTLRVPDLSKVHLGADGEELKILASICVLDIDFFDHGNFGRQRPRAFLLAKTARAGGASRRRRAFERGF